MKTNNIKIGITIALKESNESFWTNGMKLNILTLIRLLKSSKMNYDIYLLNTSDVDITNANPVLNDIQFYQFIEKYKEMDLIVAMGSQIKFELMNDFKSIKDTNKIISYKCGNNYVISLEEILFKESEKFGFYEDNLDEIWYVPQQHQNNNGYYKTLYRTNAINVPFIWDNYFLDESLRLVDKSFEDGKYTKDRHYKPKEKKVIGVMEPNLNIVKTCIIPSLLVEECYRGEIGKNKIEKLMLTNAINIAKNKTFFGMIKTFDLHKDKKISADSRYQTAYFVSQYSDIIVCHQDMNPLNYLYLDVAYMGYPVLHNAPMCKDVGYYYEGSDTKDGAKQLEWILENHDIDIEMYKKRTEVSLWRYNIKNPEIIKTYDRLIHNLFNGGNPEDLQYDPTTNNYKNLKWKIN